MLFHQMKDAYLFVYRYQMSTISQRKHVVDLVLILNLKMPSMLNPRMDSLMRDLQLFIFRDHLLQLQWEELITRFTIARRTRFVCINPYSLRCLSERQNLTLPQQMSHFRIS